MSSVNQIASEIIAREGGFVNDPDDQGGATNYGVTIGTMRRLKLDLDGDGDVDVADVRILSRDQARDIFVDHYFYGPRIDDLPQILHATVFDMQVNAGANAIIILQRLLQDMGYDVSIDGALGPQTIEAARRAAEAAPHHIVDAYGIARRDYYLRLADKRAANRKFAKRRDGGKGGWVTRAEAFMSPHYHLSQQQFTERTKSWG
jgi:lysozyme family protein